MDRRLFLRNLSIFGFVPLFARIKLGNNEKQPSHPWYVELECEKCGDIERFFTRTQDSVTTTAWYEGENRCSKCEGKRISFIGNVVTDNPPNKDLEKSWFENLDV